MKFGLLKILILENLWHVFWVDPIFSSIGKKFKRKKKQGPIISPSLPFLSLYSFSVLCFFFCCCFSSRNPLCFSGLGGRLWKFSSLSLSSEIMILDKGSMQSNLGCFLHCTTPVVNSQFLSKVSSYSFLSFFLHFSRFSFVLFILIHVSFLF